MFEKKIYVARRAELCRKLGGGVYLFLGNNEVGANYEDNGYAFRQDSTFLYYFGLDYAGLAAIIDVDENRQIIFGNDLTIDDIVWTGPMPTLAENASEVGITDTRPMSALAEYIHDAESHGRKVDFLPPYRGDHKVWLQDLFGINPAEQAAKASVPFRKAIIDMRLHKQPEEIEEIEKAVDISTRMHLAAYRAARPGVEEAQIAALVRHIASEHGETLSYPTIATVRGEILHNHGFIHTLKPGDIFLLDAGAESKMHYAGDLSSSCPVSDRFDERQEVIYNIHLKSYYAAVNTLKPGVPFRNAHIAAAVEICKGMKDLGLMKGDPVEAAESGAYALFFPCGLGHSMGLDVHDMENLGEQYVGYEEGHPKSTQFGFKSLRLARPVEPGYVFTIEPGIYFDPQLMDYWQAEKKFTQFINYDKLAPWRNFTGLRNEMNYVITNDGIRLLGKLKKPMTLEEVYAAKG